VRVTKDRAIKEIEIAMRREIADREADIQNLIKVAEHLVNHLPCSFAQHGDDWLFAWQELSDSSQEELTEVAINAHCEVDEMKMKYFLD